MDGILPYDVGLIAFLVMFAVSRILTVRAAKALSPEKKAELVDKFSGLSAYGILPMIGIAILYFLALRFGSFSPKTLMWAYLVAIVVAIVVNQIITARKLRELQLDRGYLRSYAIARMLSMAGLAVFVLTVMPING